MPKTMWKKLTETNDVSAFLEKLELNDVASMLIAANNAYYNEGEPLATDDLYDIVKDFIEERDPEHPVLARIGAPVIANATKVRLPFWMGSMDKIRDDPKMLERWVKNYSDPSSYVISDKLDGNSAMYHVTTHGHAMYSRGDGLEGQDVSHILPYVQGIPKGLTVSKEPLAVRGELIISKKGWSHVSDKGANARNVVAGLMHATKRANENADVCRHVEFVAYELLSPRPRTPEEGLASLAAMGFRVVYHEVSRSLSMKSLSDILIARRTASPYEIDGIVIYHNGTHRLADGKNPKYAFAFKTLLTHDEAEVIVTNVEWNISKDGYIKPTVIFPPVSLDSVVIQRATGFNAKFINDNKIGPGSRITIIRSGQVIPHIHKVLSPAANNKPALPKDIEFVWNDTGVDIVVSTKGNDPQMNIRQMEHFAKTMKVRGLAIGTITTMYEGGIKDISSLLKASTKDLVKAGVGPKNAEKLSTELSDMKSRATCIDYMVALNLFGRGFGQKKLEAIVRAFPGIVAGRIIPSATELSSVEGIGVPTATSFIESLPDFYKAMDSMGLGDLCSTSKTKTAKPKNEHPVEHKNSLEGMVVVFTGVRDKDLENEIVSRGGKVTGSVSKNTTIVIAKDPSETTGKLAKAHELGIQVVTLDMFRKKYT